MSLNYRSRTDTAVITVACTTFLTFLIVNQIGSIWVLYPNVLLTIGWFGYLLCRSTEEEIFELSGPREDPVSLKSEVPVSHEKSVLSRCMLFGVAATALYLPIDWFFSRKAHIVFYLRSEFERLGVPLGLILTWAIFAMLMAYCYDRGLMIFRHRLIAAVLTGLMAGIGATIIYQLGESELWIWNATRVGNFPHIASVPVFVPIAFFLTFLLCPYYFHREQHPVVAGIRCGIFMGALQFFSFLLFYVF